MCGILGIVAQPGEQVDIDRSALTAMRDEMLSRGPDGAGIFENRNLAFAHRRLAIRDLTGGHQPWVSDDGNCVLVYNGEIYNDDALRDELTAAGHRFKSRCDTEVVMEAYRRWGTECVQHLRGMFALGIYDFQRDRLFLARDRFGIKPLYFATVGRDLVFASSVAAILRHPRVSPMPNLKVASHYLTTFRVTLGRETMYDGIQQLQPAEYLIAEAGRREIVRYWQPPQKSHDPIDYESAAAELDSTLQESVRCHLASDVPVGAFVSGGVDSNTILSMMQTSQTSGLKAFCGGGDEASPDFTYARRCASHFDCDYDEVHVNARDYLESWQHLVAHQRLPLSTPTDVIIYRLAERMKQHVGVALGGEGADELLCGYAVQHWSGRDFTAGQSLQAGRYKGTPLEADQCRESLMQQYGRLQFASEGDHYLALNSLIPTTVKPQLLQPWAWKLAEDDHCMRGHYDRMFGDRDGEHSHRKQAAVIHQVNLEALLSRLDRSTMAAGLEARVPYADHVLVDKMFRLPMRYKIDVAEHERAPHLSSASLQQRGSLRSKRLLRTIAQRRLPMELASRKKASFPTPVANWFAGAWQPWVQQKLTTSPFARNLFQAEPLAELAANPAAAGMWLWPIVNLSVWGDQEFAAA